MNLVRHDRPDACLAVANGRIDHASADTFLISLQGIVASHSGDHPLVLDFSAVDYISSAGLRALMVVARQVKGQGGRMGIASLQPLVREVFSIARFELIVPCFDDIDAAIRGLA